MARVKRKLHFCTKLINGIAFTSHDYDCKKGKYLIDAEGYSGKRWVGYDTWEKRNNGDKTDRRSSFHPENKRWFQTSFKKLLFLLAPQSDFELLLDFAKKYALPKKLARLNKINDDKKVNFLINIIYSSTLMTSKENLKQVYRELSKAFHPDLTGSDGLLQKNINEIFNL